MRIKISFVILSMVCFTRLYSQDIDRDVIIVKDYSPTLSDAKKIVFLPKTTDTLAVQPKFDYEVFGKQINTNYKPEPINPAKMEPETIEKLYGNYLKLGFGTEINPLAELYINSLRSRKIVAGIFAKHYSQHGKVNIDDETYYPWLNKDEISVYGTKFNTKTSVSGNIDYSFNKYFLYSSDSTVNKKDMDYLRYNYFAIGTTYQSNNLLLNKLNHKSKFKFSHIDNNESNKENSFEANTELMQVYKDHEIGLDAGLHYFEQPDLNRKNTIFEFCPKVERQREEWSYTVGFKTVFTFDPVFGDEVHFYPNLKFNFIILNNYLISYFGFVGKHETNNLLTLSNRNPYVTNSEPYHHSSFNKIIYGGIFGNLSHTINYNLKAQFTEADDYLFFNCITNNFWEIKNDRFIATYDKVNIINVAGELKYQQNEKLIVSLNAEYQDFFDLQLEEKPWFVSPLTVSLAANYNLQEKIILKYSLTYKDKFYYKNYTYNELTSSYIETDIYQFNSTIVMNLGLEYRYNKKMSAFINFNNLTGEKYFDWNNYYNYRFNMMFGVSYSF